MGKSKRIKSPRDKYRDQKFKAAERGIAFLLSFDEWWKIWLDSGHWLKRGYAPGCYVMARYNDKGAYEVGNVRICLAEENHAEYVATPKVRAAARGNKHFFGRKHSAETRAKISANARRSLSNPIIRTKMRVARLNYIKRSHEFENEHRPR
jgi:hypothetical protein